MLLFQQGHIIRNDVFSRQTHYMSMWSNANDLLQNPCDGTTFHLTRRRHGVNRDDSQVHFTINIDRTWILICDPGPATTMLQ